MEETEGSFSSGLTQPLNLSSLSTIQIPKGNRLTSLLGLKSLSQVFVHLWGKRLRAHPDLNGHHVYLL